MRYKHQEVRRNHKNECEQNNNSVFCYDNSTVALFYEIKLAKDDNVYLHKIDKSKSFLKQFASLILSIYGISSTCRRFDGTSVNFPALFPGDTCVTQNLTDHAILFSINQNDQYLTFDDFTLNIASNVTRVAGYPIASHSFFADRAELTISDSYLYIGQDTYLYAIGLRSKVNKWAGTTFSIHFLFAKDVFDPPLELLSNSRVDLSYKIVISV